MVRADQETRNFLFFLNDIHPQSLENSLIGALATGSSWDAVGAMIKKGRQNDTFVRSIKKLYLYIHVPFCSRICTFCHCPKVLLRQHSEIDDYIKVLIRQMKSFSAVYKDMDAGALSFGGGTPSILNEKEMDAVLNGVDQYFPVAQRRIFTEVHPSSWTLSKLNALRDRGLYRISIGVQSFDENVLKEVARSQTKEKVLWCLRSARKASVPRINVDLIAGLPGQTTKGFIRDLKLIINEGANEIHLQPYTSFPLNRLLGAGETISGFLKRRDTMMSEGAAHLEKAGFRYKGLGGHIRQEVAGNGQWEYLLPKRAYASFGPFAIGDFPGAVFYRAGASETAQDLPNVEVAAQDLGYTMSHYTAVAIINGLDEQVFFKYFGVTLEQHCGEALRYLENRGLIAHADGKWKFSGKWEFRRLHEYVVLSRLLFGKDLLTLLRTRFRDQYDPTSDYSNGSTFLRAYAQNWLMTVYYHKKV